MSRTWTAPGARRSKAGACKACDMTEGAGTRFASNQGVHIAYEVHGEAGPDRPWLVLVHGLGYGRWGWESVVRRLAERFRVILHDNRGIGASDVPAGLAGQPSLVEQINALRLSHRFDLAGWQSQAIGGATYNGANRWRSIAAPTLLIHGTADTVVDYRNSKLLASGIPDARLVLFEGAGHLLFWEQPER